MLITKHILDILINTISQSEHSQTENKSIQPFDMAVNAMRPKAVRDSEPQ
jgi:hypothetical protein